MASKQGRIRTLYGHLYHCILVLVLSIYGVQCQEETEEQSQPVIGRANDYNCDNFPDYPGYIEQWEFRFPKQAKKLFPYGEIYCDSIANSNQIIIGFDPGIQFDVPYYGKTYKSLWISPCGFIAMSQQTPSQPIPFIWHNSLPNPLYPQVGATDPPLIAAFYSEANLLRPNPFESAKVAYRILDPRRALTTKHRVVTEGMLNDISMEVRRAVLGSDHFDAFHGIVVTWHEITFAGNDCNGGSGNCARNTYQVALVTDGTETYTVLSYYNMTWVGGGSSQNCDRLTGTRTGTSPNCKPGHVGFNAGEGRWFHALPFSGDDSLTDIDTEGGSNVTGRFYYRVSSDTVFRGGCTNDINKAGPRWPTQIYPETGGMLGGTDVQISGPCYTTPERLKCRYGDVVTDAIFEGNIMKLTCVAPVMNSVGPVKLGVSVDGGNNFQFEAYYIVVTPDHVTPQVSITRQKQDWLDPVQLELRWDPGELSRTSAAAVKVNIKVYGYREDDSSGSPQAVWEVLQTLKQDYGNTGIATMNVADNQCPYDAEDQMCTSYDTGAIQVSIVYDIGFDPTNPRRIWSRVIPLGWYIKDAMTQASGSDWIQEKCQLWQHMNDKDTTWINELSSCPCTYAQAYTDFGRFQPDPFCRRGTTGLKCERHTGAEHCVLSVYYSSKGAGNQCCYDSRGDLMHSGDSEYGSRPMRSHVWGAAPYKTPPRVPMLSHWWWDLTGFFYCCEWQTNKGDCHSKYLTLRQTRDCKHYDPPGQAMAYGDPHFKTFDGVSYTFNGYGEFWLMQVLAASVNGQTVDFSLHGRFEQPANQSWGETKGTYLTAVGMQLNDDHLVVVELNKEGMQKKLLIHINDYMLDLTHDDHRRHEFPEFIIINNDAEDNIGATNFTIVYRCGMGLQVMWQHNMINLVVSAPPEFKHKTLGLFGKWNDDPVNDLEPPLPGGPAFTPEETEKVHHRFGKQWRVTSTESCFRHLYRVQLNHEYYNRDWFVPNYIPQFPPNSSGFTEEMVNNACGPDIHCAFDYKATLNENIGKTTRKIQEWDQQRREMGQPVLSCGWLAIPFSIKQQPVSYLVGSHVAITGCIDGYTLEGPTTYTCESQGDGHARWTPTITTNCRGPDDPLAATTTLAIAIPAALGGLLLIIGIIVLALCLKKRKKKKRQARDAKQAYVPVFQEIFEWKQDPKYPPTPLENVTKVDVNKPPARSRANSKEGMADIMGPGDKFSIMPPVAGSKKPPRPNPASYDGQRSFETDSLDYKQDYENKMMQQSSDDSAQNQTLSSSNTGNHVSWDTQDGDKLSDSKPLKHSTLQSQKPDVSYDPSASPKVKKKRPYNYPTQSRDNSQEDWDSNSPTLTLRSQGAAPPVASYKPRDVHAYTKGHNIPTADAQSSDYYARKYGRHGAGYEA